MKNYLLEKYEKRRLVHGRLYNNATMDNIALTQEQFINEYLNKPYILSGYACFYKNQNDSVNISSAALANLGKMRKANKKKMEAAEHGSDDYIYYRILQLTYKLLMNSYYGILGERNSVFYNPFVQNSITMTAQDLITTAIIALEAFLANNCLFEDTDDVLTHIDNIKTADRKFSILSYIDAPIYKEELVDYLCGHSMDPEKINRETIESVVSVLDDETIARCYYANQLSKLIENTWFKEKLDAMLKYTYAEAPAPEIEADLEEFKAKVLEFAFYDFLIEERYKKTMKYKRRAIITIDTDSVFMNMNNYVIQISNMLGLDRSDETQQVSLVNILLSLTTVLLKQLFWLMTTNLGLVDEAKPIINMKSEFLYKRIMLTRNKKNYGGVIIGELGKLLKKPALDIKGLSIKKTTVPKKLRKEFTAILEEDILRAPKINLLSIIKKYDNLGLSVEESLRTGKPEYLLPKNVEVISSYKSPDTIEPVRALLTWNALEPESQIIPPEKINIVKLRPELTDCLRQITSSETLKHMPQELFEQMTPEVQTLIKEHPEKVAAIWKVIFAPGKSNIDFSRFGFSVVAIPKAADEIPAYLRPFINYKDMVNANMTNGYIMLESLGVVCEEVNTVKYKSNIINI